MSSDNFTYVDYHPDADRGAFSVTNGSASDEETPTWNASTKFFDSATKADQYARNQWSEYGEVYSPAFNQYIRQRLKQLEAKP